DQPKWVEWDVTALVRQWTTGDLPHQGFFLRGIAGEGSFRFHSREFGDSALRPQLIVSCDAKTVALAPLADTHLEPSTYRSQGNSETLTLTNGSCNVLLRFPLDQVEGLGQIERAMLRMYCFSQYGNRSVTVGVFRCSQGHELPPSKPIQGIAGKYAGDRRIEADPDVIFFTDFESDDWAEEWTYTAERDKLATITLDPALQFQPLQGKSLRVRIAEGSTGALNTIFKFQREIGREPEEIYFRYYLRLADDWNQTLQGGKMPGISGTYGVAGWGGRKSDGTDGWSARGAFHLTVPADNPLGGTTPIGTYCYHADMEGTYGDIWIWQRDYRGYLENNRWYCIEQYLKLNTVDEKDGVLRTWVDGRLAFEKTDIRFRRADRLKIEQIWMNVYHGGTQPSPYDQHLYIDNVVIARQYIGPMGASEDPASTGSAR
ncbi:MAG: DNRLRE domain-containing protein, partial [Planctomycetes bacterium]|nr:DNRLRE domain-containing protein [Planctomycetota bacterium]